MSACFHMAVTDRSQVAEARRRASSLARASGLDATEVGKVAIVVTEMVSNLVKHARDGELLVRALGHRSPGGVEAVAIDRGPGMADVSRPLRDGYSTAGTAGTGLGAIARLATAYDVYSVPGQGTALLARIAEKAPTATTTALETGVAWAPKTGEEVCGDGWAVREWPDHLFVLVVDGLGHGPEAAAAATVASDAFQAAGAEGPAATLAAVHDALRPTRGAAVGIADVRPREHVVRFAGLGNIAGGVYAPTGTRSFVSMNGIAGHVAPKLQEFSYPWADGAALILHSDGLESRWSLAPYPGLLARHPSVAAAVLCRDFRRRRDDVTVLVARGALA